MRKKELTQREFARLGGQATLKKHGRKFFRALRQKGIEKARKLSPKKVDNN